MKRIRMIPAWILCLMILCLPVFTFADGTQWTAVPASLCPGKEERFVLTAPAGRISVSVIDENGNAVAQPFSGESDGSAETVFVWDGTGFSGSLPAGSYTLRLFTADGSVDAPLVIGTASPAFLSLDADETITTDWQAVIETNTAGTVTVMLDLEGESVEILSVPVNEGVTTLYWDGLVNGAQVPAGDWDATFRLTDSNGVAGSSQIVNLIKEETPAPSPAGDVSLFTPDSLSGVQCDHDICYWKLNMGETDQEAVWSVLMQPVTVLKGGQRDRVKVRQEPSKSCKTYTGEVTCASQAVHVLEEQDGWTRIEAYSSSDEDSTVKVYARQFTGWVESSLLEQKEVSQEYGIVIDKLQQRMYLYKEGSLYSTLLVSTGYSTPETPWNETPAGEFLIVSWTGGFWSSNLFCDMALRINSVILIHEVPCVITYNDDGSEAKRDYWRCERYLGEKASHGCIRTQRSTTPEGVNMKWLWDNLDREKPVKVIIWDELYRELSYPDDDYVLYYNANGGKYYHSSPTCSQVSEKYWPLTAFTYDQLDESPYASLTACPGCAPQLRRDGIDTVNSKHDRDEWMK